MDSRGKKSNKVEKRRQKEEGVQGDKRYKEKKEGGIRTQAGHKVRDTAHKQQERSIFYLGRNPLVMRRHGPISDSNVLGRHKVRVGHAVPRRVEDDLERIGSTGHVDGEDGNARVLLISNLTFWLGRNGRIRVTVKGWRTTCDND